MAVDSTVTYPPRSPDGGSERASLSPGTLVADRFRIEEMAGRGGMGSVFRATDLSTGRDVALKLLHASSSPAPDVAYRFNREAILLAGLSHPAIVSYVAHGTAEEGQPFLAMEWLEGEDLARRLSRQPLGLPETLALLRRAAEALASAHRQGIVHRDILPTRSWILSGMKRPRISCARRWPTVPTPNIGRRPMPRCPSG
ncbi:serine/threonine protein kinase [Archangium violaceum]|uniref:serine/threonine-protein kinase n=1 Tax=Archangium violaceum TaxID=83451 RepID=UPI00193B280C|nr:serine/threonine-protein kinase [Archangium violaceum]QRK06598.1 serine/threonine protein kinase [Archangium violaceum]